MRVMFPILSVLMLAAIIIGCSSPDQAPEPTPTPTPLPTATPTLTPESTPTPYYFAANIEELQSSIGGEWVKHDYGDGISYLSNVEYGRFAVKETDSYVTNMAINVEGVRKELHVEYLSDILELIGYSPDLASEISYRHLDEAYTFESEESTCLTPTGVLLHSKYWKEYDVNGIFITTLISPDDRYWYSTRRVC